MAKNSVRIRLKAYEHRILDASAEKIVQAAQAHGAKKIVGPVPLPTEKQVVTVLRAVHKLSLIHILSWLLLHLMVLCLRLVSTSCLLVR